MIVEALLQALTLQPPNSSNDTFSRLPLHNIPFSNITPERSDTIMLATHSSKPRIAVPRIAVVGGGHLGRIHAKLLAANPQCDLVAVAEPSAESAALVKSALDVQVVDDYRSLAGNVDGVVIAAPTFLHHEIGTWCLKNNIHVFMEKPIASTVEQASEMVRIAQEQQLVLQVGHVERFNPAWRAICDNTNRDSVRYIESVREGTYTGRSTDIGIVMDLMIHDIDLILSLVKDPVEHINAFGWSVLSQHEDFAVAQLRFKNGTLAQLKASRVSETATRSMNIYCDEAIKRLDFSACKVTVLEPLDDVASGDRQADALNAVERSQVKDHLFTKWLHKTELSPAATNAIVDEHNEFMSALVTGSQVTVAGKDALAALEVACSIVQSIQQGAPLRSIIPGRFAA